MDGLDLMGDVVIIIVNKSWRGDDEDDDDDDEDGSGDNLFDKLNIGSNGDNNIGILIPLEWEGMGGSILVRGDGNNNWDGGLDGKKQNFNIILLPLSFEVAPPLDNKESPTTSIPH